jgi:hypothetical protein
MIVLVLSLIFGWTAEFIDVQGAFLCGNFQDEEQINMSIPEGFEQFYPIWWLLLLLQTLIYGLRKVAKAFFIEVKRSMTNMNYEQSKVERCLFFAWTTVGLILWVTWVDDSCILWDKDGVKAANDQMKSIVDYDDLRELTEYVGCKIERISNYL